MDGFSLGDAAAAATAVGVLVAAWALFLQRSQARTGFEDQVVRQYREIIRPELIGTALLRDVLATVPEDERIRFQQIYLYLDLCNGQVFLRLVGRVSRATWKVPWSAGIRDNISDNPAVADTWQLIKANMEDFRELRAFEASGWRDPRSSTPLWRRVPTRFGFLTQTP